MNQVTDHALSIMSLNTFKNAALTVCEISGSALYGSFIKILYI